MSDPVLLTEAEVRETRRSWPIAYPRNQLTHRALATLERAVSLLTEPYAKRLDFLDAYRKETPVSDRLDMNEPIDAAHHHRKAQEAAPGEISEDAVERGKAAMAKLVERASYRGEWRTATIFRPDSGFWDDAARAVLDAAFGKGDNDGD